MSEIRRKRGHAVGAGPEVRRDVLGRGEQAGKPEALVEDGYEVDVVATEGEGDQIEASHARVPLR
jgi:hypothetical protein